MNISLQDIESAIKRNFVLDPQHHLMETAEEQEYHREGNQMARLVFVGAAIQRGFTSDDVCNFLGMTLKEFQAKTIRYREMLKGGQDKANRLTRDGVAVRDIYDKIDSDKELRLWRKVLLVNNCLNLTLQSKTLEFRKSLPNYVD